MCGQDIYGNNEQFRGLLKEELDNIQCLTGQWSEITEVSSSLGELLVSLGEEGLNVLDRIPAVSNWRLRGDIPVFCR